MPWTPIDELRTAVEAAAADLRNGKPAPAARADARAPEEGRLRRLLDQRRDAARARAGRAAARDRRAARRRRCRAAGRRASSASRSPAPGFLNVFLADAWYVGRAAQACSRPATAFGGGARRSRPSGCSVEFVSANPTGPLTAASGRHAAYGDALRADPRARRPRGRARVLLQRRGRAGRTGSASRSAPARAARRRPRTATRATTWPSWRAQIPGAADAGRRRAGRQGRRADHGRHPRDARALPRRVRHAGSSSARLHEGDPSAVRRALALLRGAGPHLPRPRARCGCARRAFGDDKDRVLERSSGEPTYFAADVAYHEDKLERGFDRLINVLGADHHGYVARMKAAMAALGADPDRLEIPILQFVHLVEGGERASMSKRRGDFVTLDELIDEIGVDATRFFMLQRSHDSTVDLDLDLAREQSQPRTPSTTSSTPTRGSPRSCARRATERVAAALAARRRGARARAGRARAGQEAARVPGRGRRGGRAARAAPDRRLRARARAGVHGLLPRLPRRRRRARGARVLPASALSVATQRTIARVAGPARRQRAGVDVARPFA